MPNLAARERMLRIEFGNEVPQGYPLLKKEFLPSLDGFSASDIRRLTQETLQGPLREIEAATHFVRVGFLGPPLRCPSSRKAFRRKTGNLEAVIKRIQARSRWAGEE